MLSIPHYVIKKVRTHRARHGKTEAQKQYPTRGRDVAKELTARKNITKDFDRCLRGQVYRDSQLKIGWTEQKCIEMDKLAQEDHSYRLSRDEFQRYQKTVVPHIKQIGQESTDATSIRLPSCSHNQEPSPSRIRRRTCRTYSFFNNIKDGTLLPQVVPGGTGTRPKAGGAHEFNSFHF